MPIEPGQVLLDFLRRTPDGPTNFDIDSERVEPGEIWHVIEVAVTDETSAYTALEIGIWDGHLFARFTRITSPQANIPYSFSEQLILGEGMRLRARLIGTTSGDKLTMVLNGTRYRVR